MFNNHCFVLDHYILAYKAQDNAAQGTVITVLYKAHRYLIHGITVRFFRRGGGNDNDVTTAPSFGGQRNTMVCTALLAITINSFGGENGKDF